MSNKQENVIIMLNKLKTAKTKRNLQEEFDVVYEDLTRTREELGQAMREIVSLQENMEKQIFKIVDTMKILKDNNNIEELGKYIDIQHSILKIDLSDNNHDDRQVIIKIFK